MNQNNQYKIIYIANDHAGVDLKNKLIKFLSNKYQIINLGTNQQNSVDYVDYGIKLAQNVAENQNALGIAICGSGNGINISCNKVNNIRSAILYNKKSAIYAKKHNNANVIVFSSRFIKDSTNIRLLKCFLNSDFEGERHQIRINKIHEFEKLK